jgi:hypothetical protein
VQDADVAPALGELDEALRQVHGPGRAADLVSHHAHLVALVAEGEHRVDEVAPAGAVEPGRAHDRVLGGRGRHLLLARELRAPVGAKRVHRIGLDPRLPGAAAGVLALAVEDVVGRDVHDARADLGRRARDVAGAVAVDSGRGRLGRLGAVDVGPRRAVDDRARLGRRDDAAHVTGIGDVELGAGEGDDIVPQPGGGGGDSLPKHARASGDQQAHRTQSLRTPARSALTLAV